MRQPRYHQQVTLCTKDRQAAVQVSNIMKQACTASVPLYRLTRGIIIADKSKQKQNGVKRMSAEMDA